MKRYVKKTNKNLSYIRINKVVICNVCMYGCFIMCSKQDLIRHYVKKITEHMRLYILLEGCPLDDTRGVLPRHLSRLDFSLPLYDSAPLLLHSAFLLYDFSVYPQTKAAPTRSEQPHHVTHTVGITATMARR